MSVRAVNTILSKNRRIISRFIHEHPDEEISSSALARLGFNFEYFTGQGIKENKIYNQCYEFGYVCEDDGHYKVFKLSTKKQESDNL